MRTGVTFVLAMGLATYSAQAASSDKINDWQLSKQLLSAIIDRDSDRVKALANNTEIFDSAALEYLIGEDSYRFPTKSDRRSASSVLRQGAVLQKLVITENKNGTRSIEIVYLPAFTAEDFSQLSVLSKSGRAEPFRDYVVCSFVIENGKTYMPHACYAETDGLD